MSIILRRLVLVVLVITLLITAIIILVSRQPATANKSYNYIALGDSVAAGDGLDAGSLASNQDKLCSRSPDSYPVRVALQLHLNLDDRSCGSAKISALFGNQIIGSASQPPQLNASLLQNHLKLITITMGANDVGFISALQRCYSVNCDTPANTVATQKSIETMKNNLIDSLQKIKLLSSNHPPQIVVTSYYNILSPTCGVFAPQVSHDEVSWIIARTNDLNAALRSAAQTSSVSFASVDFSGHDLCTRSSWIQDLSAKAPLHPTVAGQAAIAKAVLQTIQR